MVVARLRMSIGAALVAVLAVAGTISGAAPALAAPKAKDSLDPAVDAVREVPWTPVRASAPSRPALHQMRLPEPQWPAPGSGTVLPGASARTAPGTVVSVAAAAPAVTPSASSTVSPSSTPTATAGATSSPSAAPSTSATPSASVSAAPAAPAAGSVEVTSLSAAVADKLGGIGLAFTVDSTDATPDVVELKADVSGFTAGFGADLAEHLVLKQLPGCALSTPDARGCSTVTEVPSHVDLRTGTLVVEKPVTAAAVGADEPVFVVAAAPDGESGSFAATSLGVSSSWSVGGQSGDFSWTYPIPEAPAVAGDTPKLQMMYSAQSVDGLVSSKNTQPTWTGLGWNLSVPYLERSYRGCPAASGLQDKCWGGDVLSLSMGSSSGRLVRDRAAGGDVWRSRSDDGSTVRRVRVPAGQAGNGDDDGEYWELTSTDGTVYTFGRGRDRVSGDATNSVFTQPVYGLDAGDPCHAGTQAASWCQQAYRWNLDRVVDAHGNEQSYSYEQEINYYQRGGTTPTRYVRDGHVTSVTYGRRVGTDAPATSRLFLDTRLRCSAAADGAGTCPALSDENTTAYPDVPTYLLCAQGEASCTQRSPSYFTGVLLGSVTSQRRSAAGWVDVDRVDLSYSFPRPTDGTSASLWLERIRRTGLSGGGSARLPDLTFAGTELPNRIDFDAGGGVPEMRKLRISSATDELGRVVGVTYGQANRCDRGNFPQGRADTNTQDCFPALRVNGSSEARYGWYYKYLALSTRVQDGTGGSPTQVTRYDYRGPAAWHLEEDLFPSDDVPLAHSDWRGYGEVDVSQLSTAGTPLSRTRTRYFRGMDGDPLADGTPQRFAVADSRGGSTPDLPWLNGRVREVQQFQVDAAGSPDYELGGTLSTYGSARTTPAGTGGADADADAHLVVNSRTVGRQTIVPEGGGTPSTRSTQSDTTYDQYGQTLTVTASGGGLTRCTRNSFARDAATVAAGMLAYAYRVRAYEGTCAAPVRLLSGGDTFYDGATTAGAPVTRGDPTRVVSVVAATGPDTVAETVATSSTFDAYGRATAVTNGRGATTRTAFTPATGAVASTAVTNALGQVSATSVDPDRGQPTAVTDANGRTTRTGYDPLGRKTSVRTAEQAAGDPPAWTSTYDLDPARVAAPKVTSRQLQSGSTYLTVHQFSDSLGRARQTQRVSPSSTAGAPQAIVSDTRYDERGLVSATTVPSVAAGQAGSALIAVSPSATDETRTSYDPVGRTVRAALYAAGTLKWATTNAYFGDHARTTPPAGGVAKTTWTDLWGRTVRSDDGVGAALVSQTFGYDAADRQVTATDPAGHVSRRSYDLLGRVIAANDPDAGASTTSYDASGNVTRSSDARGRVLSTDYDLLDRATAVWDGASGTGTRLHAMTYDSTGISNGIGRLAREQTFDGRSTYTRAVTGFDPRGRATGSSWTFPAGVGLALIPTTYTTSYTYDAADHRTSIRYNQAVIGAGKETVTTGYDPLGYVRTLSTTASGLLGDTTSALVSGVDYAADGKVLRREFADNLHPVTRQYSYEPGSHRLANVSTLVGGPLGGEPAVKQDDDYTWDPSGNLSRVTDQTTVDLLHADPVNTCYGYDGLARLTRAWTSRTPGCTDASSTTVHDGPAGMNKAWTYSPDGNVTSSRSLLNTDTYRYEDAAHPHAVTSKGLNSYSYGADGAQTSRREGLIGTDYDWNAQGRLVKSTKKLLSTRFVYAADGTRLARLNPDTTATLYIEGQEIVVAKGISSGTRFYSQDGVGVATRTVTGVAWQLNDENASAQMSIAKGSSLVKRTYYDPYGAVRSGLGGSDPRTEHGFLDAVKDPQTGLNHLGARYYDAELGRFLSVDPLMVQASAQSVNSYAYGNNNPLMYSDPTGLWGIPNVVKSAANAVTNAASATVGWVGEHKAEIAGVAAGVVVGLAIVGTCATVVGCIAIGAAAGLAAGAVGGATTYTVQTATTDEDFSLGGLVKASATGGLWGAVTGGGVGGALRAFAPFLSGAFKQLASALSKTSRPKPPGVQKLGPAVRGGKGGADDAGPAVPKQDPGSSSGGGGSTSGQGLGASTGSTGNNGSTIKVFRVEGPGNARIDIDPAGDVTIKGNAMLFLNFGDRARADAFLAKRLAQGAEGTTIKSFDVPTSYYDDLVSRAVPETEASAGTVINVDITRTSSSYGLRSSEFGRLTCAIVPGSGC